MLAALDRGMGSFHRHPAEIAPASFGDAPGDVQVTVQAYPCAQSGEYPETAAGKTHTFTARNVRYVRDWLNGSTANVYNHWVEIEAWGTATTAYLGNYFEWTGSANTMVKYYYSGSQRVGLRRGSTLNYLLGDHLGSTSLTADNVTGRKLTELRYKPWGENRSSTGSTPTTFRFTGQRSEESSIGLYYYGARWYDPYLNRWIQPDPIIPEPYNPLAFDRYQYVYSNPVRYTDPSGHCIWDLCIIEGVGLVELALVVGGSAVALYAASPAAREAYIQAMTEGLDWATEQINNGLDRLRALAKSTTPKPLTPDEQGHVDKLNKGIDDFLAEHPDLAEEAEQVAEGETLPPGMDHVTEAKNLARGLENSIEYLQSVRDKRTAEAQKVIDQAIENAQKQLDKLREILGDS